MSKVYIVFDVEGSVYGVYDEYVDAEDRMEELDEGHFDAFLIEEYDLNKDYDPNEG